VQCHRAIRVWTLAVDPTRFRFVPGSGQPQVDPGPLHPRGGGSRDRCAGGPLSGDALHVGHRVAALLDLGAGAVEAEDEVGRVLRAELSDPRNAEPPSEVQPTASSMTVAVPASWINVRGERGEII
jgi:hypothetical protein